MATQPKINQSYFWLMTVLLVIAAGLFFAGITEGMWASLIGAVLCALQLRKPAEPKVVFLDYSQLTSSQAQLAEAKREHYAHANDYDREDVQVNPFLEGETLQLQFKVRVSQFTGSKWLRWTHILLGHTWMPAGSTSTRSSTELFPIGGP